MGSKETIVLSPVTKSKNTKKIGTIKSSLIIDLYKKEIQIDVENEFKNIDEVSIYECLDTGYRFYYPFTTIGGADFYENLSVNKPNYYSVRWEHGVTLNYLKPTDSVLEIGSGFGAFLDQLKSKKINSKGLELNPHAVAECINKGLEVKEKLVQEEAEQNPNAYSVVCFFQVLEHITDINGFISASVTLLNKNGRLIIGVPNNNPYLYINDKYHTLNLPPHHAGLWNGKALKALEKTFSLKLVSLDFEPLEVSYSYFLNAQYNNANYIVRTALKLGNKIAPGILKKTLCKFIKGRNVLAVFEKIE